MKPTTLALTAAAIASITTLLLTQPLPTAQANPDAADYEYRVIPHADLFQEVNARLKAQQQPDNLAELLLDAGNTETALNRYAADDWELVTTTPTNHFIFRRPVLN
ncbi:MAG: hypothetical protein AAF823_15870 [Planctomycetota bacterium]